MTMDLASRSIPGQVQKRSTPTASMRTLHLGQTRWRLRRDLDPVLFNERGIRLAEWVKEGLAQRIKHGSGRTIYRVRLPGLDLYVKHFRPVRIVTLLRQWFRQILGQGRAEKEFRYAQVLARHGVPTIDPIALGERRRRGALLESFLLTEAIPKGQTLFEWIERRIAPGGPGVEPAVRRLFAVELARLAAMLHEAGLEHRDLHERNIIVQSDDNDRFRFFLLDLHEVEPRRRMTLRHVERELARMGRYFTLRTSASDRLRFFLEYARLRGVPRPRARRLARRIERATIESRADFWLRRDTRTPLKNPRIRRSSGRGGDALVLRDLPAAATSELLDDPDRPFRDALVGWLKQGRATRVAEVRIPAIDPGRTFVYKQYYNKGWAHAVVALFRRNQAARAWHYGNQLLLRELPTPAPLLLVRRRRFGLPITSYLLTEMVPSARTIRGYIEERLENADDPQRRRIVRGVVEQAARLLRTLHERRVTHRDLKASNVLASPTDDPARPRLWLIDLDGVETWRAVPPSRRFQNLARFAVSFDKSPFLTRTDRLRFLRLYLGREFRSPGVWKSMWRSVRAEAERKIRRNLLKGRVAG